jgi:hypothetical protein
MQRPDSRPLHAFIHEAPVGITLLPIIVHIIWARIDRLQHGNITMEKTIDPATHAALDYGLSAAQFLGPELLGLGVRANVIGTLFGAVYGATTALTDTPLAVKPVIPFATHGALELPSIAAMAIVPWITGAMKRPKAKLFFMSCIGMALANYAMTDFGIDNAEQEDLELADVTDTRAEVLEPLLRT